MRLMHERKDKQRTAILPDLPGNESYKPFSIMPIIHQETFQEKCQKINDIIPQKPIHAKPSLYAYYLELLKEIALKYGYNLVPHGSFNRDLDLIAIPWVDDLGDKDAMIDEFAKIIGGELLMQDRTKDNINGFRFGQKPHGRIVYIININRDFEMKYNGMVSEVKEYSDPQYYIDISVIPSASLNVL